MSSNDIPAAKKAQQGLQKAYDSYIEAACNNYPASLSYYVGQMAETIAEPTRKEAVEHAIQALTWNAWQNIQSY